MSLAMRDSKRGITSEGAEEISDVLLRSPLFWEAPWDRGPMAWGIAVCPRVRATHRSIRTAAAKRVNCLTLVGIQMSTARNLPR